MKLSDLFPPSPGNVGGKCIVCGRMTKSGHRIDFSDNFTMWALLQEGDCICEHCYTLCRDQKYRRKSWVATKDGIKFLEKKDLLSTLLSPPNPPFAIYITKSGKKQGFLLLVKRPSLSRDRFFIAFEDSLVWVDRKKLEEMVAVAEAARKLKFRKSDLLDPSTKCWVHRDLCEKIVEFRKNPLWEVVVYAIP